MVEKCVECGAFAPVPPLCINCMLAMSDDEYKEYIHLYKIRETLLRDTQEDEPETWYIDVRDVFSDDERGQMAHECAMCGKYCASVDKNGHCSSCRQIWNG